ncbi:MAG: hypothetical protein H6867_06030 [Rhodospirillales bacterium]|nr:hypothetical protein [Rhodospirillales bacterium]MCB9995087.1 hypothetical protein [Rhodospirillales bacterium]
MGKENRNPALDLTPGKLQRTAFAEVAGGKRECRGDCLIDMGTHASGARRFPSRADGAERGIVENGIQKIKR